MKTVVKNVVSKEVLLSEVNDDRIYAFCYNGGVYKAHLIGDKFAFVDLANSRCWSNGSHSSLKEAVETNMEFGPVYEFYKVKEFLQWALDNSN